MQINFCKRKNPKTVERRSKKGGDISLKAARSHEIWDLETIFIKKKLLAVKIIFRDYLQAGMEHFRELDFGFRLKFNLKIDLFYGCKLNFNCT